MEITKELIKIFASWTKLKIRIHAVEEILAIPQAREIWWVNLGQNIGVETNGKSDNFERPVVVIKVFNYHCSLVAPISSTIKEDQYLIEFMTGEDKRSTINMSQLRSLSHKRFIRKMGELNYEDFSKIKKILHAF
ncbi:MAG: type II toxin-antitoxin system PemK/MazF family toxin [Candidatus Vogelbacteria bacterium]|nr:type II toxin-antitoxin system PemK/MazF family toxin [Candidatus Vogelbacteria bacterium]